jgi:hypothetical protein
MSIVGHSRDVGSSGAESRSHAGVGWGAWQLLVARLPLQSGKSSQWAAAFSGPAARTAATTPTSRPVTRSAGWMKRWRVMHSAATRTAPAARRAASPQGRWSRGNASRPDQTCALSPAARTDTPGQAASRRRAKCPRSRTRAASARRCRACIRSRSRSYPSSRTSVESGSSPPIRLGDGVDARGRGTGFGVDRTSAPSCPQGRRRRGPRFRVGRLSHGRLGHDWAGGR